MVTLLGSGFAAFVSESQPLSADEKRQAARCLGGGEFSTDLSIGGLLRNADRTSAVAMNERYSELERLLWSEGSSGRSRRQPIGSGFYVSDRGVQHVEQQYSNHAYALTGCSGRS